MRILFTGASSFTGLNMASALAEAGHEVTTTFQREPGDYEEIRAERVSRSARISQAVFGVSFGDKRFVELIDSDGPWDVFCHHAADATDYKSQHFNWLGAVQRNTQNLPVVLEALMAQGTQKVILTGTVFESDEGRGEGPLEAFSAYGLSKALTAQVFRYETQLRQMPLGKFVIPNPFGPFEEPRFTAYLIRTWQKRGLASVNTPDYVRDNIHVSLLARAYLWFLEEGMDVSLPLSRLAPSGYTESQGKFAARFAGEMRARLDLPCEIALAIQDSFQEPRVRINTDLMDAHELEWNEEQAWDELASYYRERVI